MAEDSKKDKSDIFVAQSIYPDAASVFTFSPLLLEQIKNDCYIVLDTNVLLVPYTIGKEDLLDQCRKTYKPLTAAKRLIIPGQVAREFAKNRTQKLTELHQQLSRKKQTQQMQKGKYPLLSTLKEYKEVVQIEDEIDTKLREYQKAVDKVLTYIRSWQWNDPVSSLYHEIFTEDTVLDLSLDEEEILKDLNRRNEYGIPPGYKDKGKKDEGIGDLLIWHTILEIGKKHQKSVIFVSGEEKADWYQKSEGQPLYPRYELIDEFRRVSNNQTFHIVKFSGFLELFGADKEVVEEVQREEKTLPIWEKTRKALKIIERDVTKAVLEWLQSKYSSDNTILKNPENSPDFLILQKEGTTIGVEIGFTYDTVTPIGIVASKFLLLNTIFQGRKLDRLIIFIVTNNVSNALDIAEELEQNLIIPPEITLVIGHTSPDRQFFYVISIPKF